MDTPGLILGISLILTIASIIPVVRGSAIFDDGGGEGFRCACCSALVVLDFKYVMNSVLQPVHAHVHLLCMEHLSALAHGHSACTGVCPVAACTRCQHGQGLRAHDCQC